MTVPVIRGWQMVPLMAMPPQANHFADYPLYCPSCEIAVIGQAAADLMVSTLVMMDGIPSFRVPLS